MKDRQLCRRESKKSYLFCMEYLYLLRISFSKKDASPLLELLLEEKLKNETVTALFLYLELELYLLLGEMYPLQVLQFMLVIMFGDLLRTLMTKKDHVVGAVEVTEALLQQDAYQ